VKILPAASMALPNVKFIRQPAEARFVCYEATDIVLCLSRQSYHRFQISNFPTLRICQFYASL
jgi:hypothetical protein